MFKLYHVKNLYTFKENNSDMEMLASSLICVSSVFLERIQILCEQQGYTFKY